MVGKKNASKIGADGKKKEKKLQHHTPEKVILKTSENMTSGVGLLDEFYEKKNDGLYFVLVCPPQSGSRKLEKSGYVAFFVRVHPWE